jgi:hypothetical protein
VEHLDGYLAADGFELTDDLLDRIDAIVAPGQTVSITDNNWGHKHQRARPRVAPPARVTSSNRSVKPLGRRQSRTRWRRTGAGCHSTGTPAWLGLIA